jgi:hypothetical protein
MPDTKPKTMTRGEIEAALKRGEHVAIAGRHITLKRDLPPHASDADNPPEADEFQAVVARSADGRLTRAGMENAIRTGGSVLHGGEVLTRVEDLPEDDQLAQSHQQQQQALAAQYDAQMAAIAAQKAQLGLMTAAASEAGKGGERGAAESKAEKPSPSSPLMPSAPHSSPPQPSGKQTSQAEHETDSPRTGAKGKDSGKH